MCDCETNGKIRKEIKKRTKRESYYIYEETEVISRVKIKKFLEN